MPFSVIRSMHSYSPTHGQGDFHLMSGGRLANGINPPGFGAMLSFDVKGTRADAERVMYGTKLFQLAESLGGVESLIAYPITMSHATMTKEARDQAGIKETTIRLSVGIEHPDDLAADLRNALED